MKEESCDIEPEVKLTNLVHLYMKRTVEYADYNLFQWFREFRWENKKLVKNKKYPIILNSTLGGRDDPNSDKYKEYVKQYAIRFKPWPIGIESMPDWTFEESREFKENHVRETGKDLLVPNLLKVSASGYTESVDDTDKAYAGSDEEDAEETNIDEQCDPFFVDIDGNENEDRMRNVLIVSEEQLLTAKKFFKSLSKHASKSKYDYDMSLRYEDLTADQQKVIDCIFASESGNIIVTGGAGTGKSRIVCTAMTECVKRNLPENYIKLMAYTGVAARNVSGETYNSGLSFQKHGKIFVELSPEKLTSLREAFKGTKVLIIDEFSMTSSQQLYMIHRRLQSITENQEQDFGGIKIVLIGDPAQLPPVGAPVMWNTPLTDNEKSSKARRNHGEHSKEDLLQRDPSSDAGNVLYNKFSTLINLNSSMRAANDSKLIEILEAMRSYKMTNELIETLYENNQSRIESDFSIFSAIHLCASNSKCDAYNEEAALQTLDQKFSVNSLDSLGKQQRNDPYYRQVGGVRVSVQVYGNMRMMLTNNLNTRLGLVNGAMGTIRKVCVSKMANGGTKFEYILVEFDKKLDITAEMRIESREIFKSVECSDDRYLIPIFSISGFSADAGSRRFGLPIIPANAITVHKSQGLTLDKISIDLSGVNKQQNGLLYVALSRVRSMKDMVLKKVPRKNFDKFLRIGKLTASVHDCLNEIERIQKKSIIKRIDNYNQTERYINYTEVESKKDQEISREKNTKILIEKEKDRLNGNN